MKRLILTLAFLGFALPAAAQDKLTLILDWFINPDHGPIIIAQEQGYFADEGLEVEIIPPADPADPPKLGLANSMTSLCLALKWSVRWQRLPRRPHS